MDKPLNSCSRCLSKIVPDKYFIKDKQLCECCNTILKGGSRTCYICLAEKPISLFERPYLKKCKDCAADIASTKVECKCGKLLSRGYISRHSCNIT